MAIRRAAIDGTRIIFRKIRGKIVPIFKKKKAELTVGGIFGGTVGAGIGMEIALAESEKDFKRLKKIISKPKVNTRKFIINSKLKNISLISSEKQLAKNKFFTKREKLGLRQAAIIAEKGENAFALSLRGKDFIFAGKKGNPAVIGHELGHIKDFRKRGVPGFFGTGLLGTLSGEILKTEKIAWKISASKSKEGITPALRTYERSQARARQVGATGAIASAIIAALSKGKIK